MRGLEAWEIETALTPSVVAVAFSVNAASIVDLPTAIAVCRVSARLQRNDPPVHLSARGVLTLDPQVLLPEHDAPLAAAIRAAL